MTSLDPNDIFTKLGPIAAIVFSLFGAMHLASAFAFTHDKQFQRRLVRALQNPRFQFRETSTGAWVWQVAQDPAPEDVGALAGPFAELCRAIGAPAVRLRAAIPEEVLRGEIGALTYPRAGDGRCVFLSSSLRACCRVLVARSPRAGGRCPSSFPPAPPGCTRPLSSSVAPHTSQNPHRRERAGQAGWNQRQGHPQREHPAGEEDTADGHLQGQYCPRGGG